MLEAVVRERPILFSGPMVRALLDGRKTQTRRIVKPQPFPTSEPPDAWVWSGKAGGKPYATDSVHDDWPASLLPACPYGVPGDRLWVRETLRYIEREVGPREFDGSWCYAADDIAIEVPLGSEGASIAWAHHKATDTCPSIHMPRWAARLTLELVRVRVERVQDISGDDAFAEGIQIPVSEPGRPLLCLTSRIPFDSVSAKHPKEWGKDEYARFEYAQLWNSINGPASWESNPWVWVLDFRVVP